MYQLTIAPQVRTLSAPDGSNLMSVLRSAGIFLDAPCGGNGTCGKCAVLVDGQRVLACQTTIHADMTVSIPEAARLLILQEHNTPAANRTPDSEGYLLAFDIGTTSVVCFLLDGASGTELAKCSMLNPQAAFGADVISRIRAALEGELEVLRDEIRRGMTELIQTVCSSSGTSPKDITCISVVGNPAMQQLFLGIPPDNLAGVPFGPVLTQAKRIPCEGFLPVCPKAELLVIPDISGYIGADTLACVLSTGMYRQEEMTLLVDIGTNGEMVLGNQHRMLACSTAAGPALEGANIRFGMRAAPGAIDHVWVENGAIRCSVIGGGQAAGICGSGLIDAIAAALELGLINKRGRILSGEEREGQRILCLTDTVYLTQEDIRQVQLAKGAVHAGILLMARELDIPMARIDRVLLAGAFGSFLNPASACRIGLLPEELLPRIEAVGNAAGSGAKLLACDKKMLPLAQKLSEQIEFLELATLPDFAKTFARSMNFREGNL